MFRPYRAPPFAKTRRVGQPDLKTSYLFSRHGKWIQTIKGHARPMFRPPSLNISRSSGFRPRNAQYRQEADPRMNPSHSSDPGRHSLFEITRESDRLDFLWAFPPRCGFLTFSVCLTAQTGLKSVLFFALFGIS